ncbi:3'-5' exonuclease [Desulfobulbus alkaliphilus]|uniref:3'-5' exonuclease n=1 Tax=Desulfobulbus alkaliphilus TaxID=869814 RepID=UPI0019653480|nr:3'-5' exonuclease [Desulfobulbus alkaliphilus]MBM9535840.1 3'-5' exonuclease [Desulfobulbus alkaliphilus]
MSSSTVIVLDFETSGHSPGLGDRPIEVGAVRLEGNRIMDHFQELMNPGFPIGWFIESLTGISNQQIAQAPPCEEVMTRFADWIGDTPLIAHNAAFDRRFLDAELALIGRSRDNPMACTVLMARRILPEAPNHKLATLVHYCGIPTSGIFHRALADAEMTGRLWMTMTELLRERYKLDAIPFALMQHLSRISRTRVEHYLEKYCRQRQDHLNRAG